MCVCAKAGRDGVALVVPTPGCPAFPRAATVCLSGCSGGSGCKCSGRGRRSDSGRTSQAGASGEWQGPASARSHPLGPQGPPRVRGGGRARRQAVCSSSPRRAVPRPRAASAAPPPSHDLPASAAAARAQRSRRGQNSNLFPEGSGRPSTPAPRGDTSTATRVGKQGLSPAPPAPPRRPGPSPRHLYLNELVLGEKREEGSSSPSPPKPGTLLPGRLTPRSLQIPSRHPPPQSALPDVRSNILLGEGAA